MIDKDCFDCCGAGNGLTKLDDALAALRGRVRPVVGAERVPLRQALGRILAEDLVSQVLVPPFANSAVDGWAVCADDLSATATTTLPVGGRIAAGNPLEEPVRRGVAYRIFTGAPVPAGLDAVFMQEDCREVDGQAVLPMRRKRGDHIRLAGESVQIGDVPLTAGLRLGPQHIGVAATLGLTTLPVRQALRVAIFSTGDEVCDPGQPLVSGGIYDANRFTLTTLLDATGCRVTDCGILPDRREVIRDTLERVAPDHDLIITSGGVSVGEEDHVKGAVQSLGSLNLWRLALKPGKPLALGQVGGTAFLGLPGNPVAVMVTFLLFAKPLVALMAGAEYTPPRRFSLAAGFALNKKAGRREFPRARVVDTPAGPVVQLFRSDSSGVLTSMTEGQGFVDFPEGDVTVAPGDIVQYLPFSEAMA